MSRVLLALASGDGAATGTVHVAPAGPAVGLPATGGDVFGELLVAAVLIAVGAILLVLSRRRSRAA